MTAPSTDADTIDLVLDTNVLLQGRPLKDLPWADVRPGTSSIELLLSRTVVTELDRLKGDGNNRRARRARKAAQLINNVLEAPKKQLLIREACPRVVLRLMAPSRIQWEQDLPDLDPNHSDDRLVAEAWAAQRSGRTVILVSHDVGPRHTADHLGLQTFKMPDTWLQAPEPDESEKRVKELEAKLAAVTKTQPDMTVGFESADGTRIDRIEIPVIRVCEMPPALIDAVVAALQARFPMKEFPEPPGSPTAASDLAGLTRRSPRLPSPLRIERYQNHDYPKFAKELEQYVSHLPWRAHMLKNQMAITIRLENQGGAPANGLLYEVTVAGGMELHESVYQPDLALPTPPAPPEPERALSALERSLMVGGLPGYSDSARFMPPLIQKAQDPWGFYWQDRLAPGHRMAFSLTCTEFRQERIYHDEIVILPPLGEHVQKGALTVRVSASNLPRSATATLPISVRYEDMPFPTLLEQIGAPAPVVEALRSVADTYKGHP